MHLGNALGPLSLCEDTHLFTWKEIYYKEIGTCNFGVQSSRMCSWQIGDPGDVMSSSVCVWRPEDQEGLWYEFQGKHQWV